jgi:hypothetical protein
MSLKRLLKHTILASLGSALLVVPALLWTHSLQADNEIAWGVDFSESQAEYLGLDARETYHAIIHELGAKHIKIHINWNSLEPTPDNFDFSSLDYQVTEAEQNGVKLILVVGMKTGRWPECHTPQWLSAVPEHERHSEITENVSAVVSRYKHSKAIEYWQIENEPFLEFGDCPDWYYEETETLLQSEVALVRQLDPKRKIIISESGELSDWTEAAQLADVVGVTMYRSTWNDAEKTFGLNPYSFLAPEFYSAKASFIQHAYNKPVISIELQAEPWTAKPLIESKLEIQEQSMNLELFKENVEFAKQAKLGAYYFWGVEWWYWMNTTQAKPEIWNEATALFRS